MSENAAEPASPSPDLTKILGLDPRSIEHRRLVDDLMIGGRRKSGKQPPRQVTETMNVRGFLNLEEDPSINALQASWRKNGYVARLVPVKSAPTDAEKTLAEFNTTMAELRYAMRVFQRRSLLVMVMASLASLFLGLLIGHLH